MQTPGSVRLGCVHLSQGAWGQTVRRGEHCLKLCHCPVAWQDEGGLSTLPSTLDPKKPPAEHRGVL